MLCTLAQFDLLGDFIIPEMRLVQCFSNFKESLMLTTSHSQCQSDQESANNADISNL